MKSSKVLLGIVVLLLAILTTIIFKIIDSNKKVEEEIVENKEPQQSSIQDRRNALKEVFKKTFYKAVKRKNMHLKSLMVHIHSFVLNR